MNTRRASYILLALLLLTIGGGCYGWARLDSRIKGLETRPPAPASNSFATARAPGVGVTRSTRQNNAFADPAADPNADPATDAAIAPNNGFGRGGRGGAGGFGGRGGGGGGGGRGGRGGRGGG